MRRAAPRAHHHGVTLERIPLARPVIGDRERELVERCSARGSSRWARWCAIRGALGGAHRRPPRRGLLERHRRAPPAACTPSGSGPATRSSPRPFSFVASANAILFTGATPVFAEVDPLTFNMDPAAVEAAITPRTRAIEIVDIFGYPAEIPRWSRSRERHGLAMVEDACQSIDGDYDGRKLGTFGHPAVYGFYANKQLTTAEGGVVLTDDDELAGLLKSLTNQGRSDNGAWLVHSRLGFNYRLSDVHSAIGVAQLERLDDMLAGRRPRGGAVPGPRGRDRRRHARCTRAPQRRSWFVYAPRLDPDLDRDAVIGDLDAVGVSAKPYLPCIHLQPYYREAHGHGPGEFPVTEAISASTIALPFFPEMTEAQVDRVCGALAEAVVRPRRSAEPGAGGAMSSEGRLWGGRFAAGSAEAFDRLNSSLEVDRRLWPFGRGGLARARPHARRPGDHLTRRTPTRSTPASRGSRASSARATSPSVPATRTSTPPSSGG